ncbi:exopolygalacturonase-like [Carex rostrata]
MAVVTLGSAKHFDVTQYSASPGGSFDSNKQAFLDAWQSVCEFNGDATLVVPTGTFQLAPLVFAGPCKPGQRKFKILGTLVAPSDGSKEHESWIEFRELHEIVVEGGGVLNGQGANAWSQKKKNMPISLHFIKVNNGRITNLALKDSKGFHIAIHQSVNVVIRAIDITAPSDSPNTDGIHISGSSQVRITGVTIGTGDDCVSIGPGSYNIIIANVRCGPGHGISIGSLGKYQDEENVAHINVRNCTIAGTTNGLRIKTWPGTSTTSQAYNITFENIKLENVTRPIIIDQEYCPNDQCNSNEPSKVKLSGISFKHIQGTTNSPDAVTLKCSKLVPCKDVRLIDIDLKPLFSSLVNKFDSICSNVLGLALGIQKPNPCLHH